MKEPNKIKYVYSRVKDGQHYFFPSIILVVVVIIIILNMKITLLFTYNSIQGITMWNGNGNGLSCTKAVTILAEHVLQRTHRNERARE